MARCPGGSPVRVVRHVDLDPYGCVWMEATMSRQRLVPELRRRHGPRPHPATPAGSMPAWPLWPRGAGLDPGRGAGPAALCDQGRVLLALRRPAGAARRRARHLAGALPRRGHRGGRARGGRRPHPVAPALRPGIGLLVAPHRRGGAALGPGRCLRRSTARAWSTAGGWTSCAGLFGQLTSDPAQIDARCLVAMSLFVAGGLLDTTEPSEPEVMHRVAELPARDPGVSRRPRSPGRRTSRRTPSGSRRAAKARVSRGRSRRRRHRGRPARARPRGPRPAWPSTR